MDQRMYLEIAETYLHMSRNIDGMSQNKAGYMGHDGDPSVNHS